MLPRSYSKLLAIVDQLERAYKLTISVRSSYQSADRWAGCRHIGRHLTISTLGSPLSTYFLLWSNSGICLQVDSIRWPIFFFLFLIVVSPYLLSLQLAYLTVEPQFATGISRVVVFRSPPTNSGSL
jgi:hypothetical protein